MRYIFNPSTGNLETADNVTSPLKPLGEKFKLAELPRHLWNNMNTPDLEQSPDSFLKPGETLEEWDETFRRPNAKGGLQRQPFAPENIERIAQPKSQKMSTIIHKGPYKVLQGVHKGEWAVMYREPGKVPAGKKRIKKLLYFKKYPDALKKYNKMKIEGQKWLHMDRYADLEKKKYAKGWKTGTQFMKWLDGKNLSIKGNPASFAGNHGIKTKVNPFNANALLYYVGDIDRLKLDEIEKARVKSGAGTEAQNKKWRKFLNIDEMRSFFNKQRKSWLKERSVPSLETGKPGKTLAGTKKLHLGHAQDISRHFVKPSNLVYTPDIINTQYIWPIDYRMREIYDEIDKIKNNPDNIKKTNLRTQKPIYTYEAIQKIRALNNEGKELAKLSKGYKQFTAWDPVTGKTTTHGVVKKMTLDPRGQFEGKTLQDLNPAERQKLIKLRNKIINKTSNKQIKADIKKFEPQVKKIIAYLNQNKNISLALGNKLNSGIPVDDIVATMSKDLKIPVGKIMSGLGKIFTVAGVATLPLDLIPFAEAEEMGLESGAGGATSWKMLGEGYANLPRLIEDLIHVAGEGTWKTFGDKKDEDRVWKGKAEFGKRAALREIKNTSLDVLLQRIDNISQGKPDLWDKAMSSLVGDPTGASLAIATRGQGIGKSSEKIKRLKDQLIETKRMVDSWEDNDPRLDTVLEKFKKIPIKPVENVFGTQLPMKSITEGFSRDQWMATGGRVGFEDGSEPEKKMSDEEILESIRSQVFELEQNWNTEKSVPGKVLDVANVTNWPYYAARMLRAGMTVAEISAKLPFVSIELLGKLATQKAFKLVDNPLYSADSQKKLEGTNTVKSKDLTSLQKERFTAGLNESWLVDEASPKKLEGQGFFTEAFHDLMPGAFADKTGLNSLIESQEQLQQDRGMSQWPQIAGKNIELGLDITLPFGYVAAAQKYKTLKKLLTSVSKDKNVNKVIEKALTDKGMSRRQFNTLLATGGIVATLKALGIDNLFKGMKLAKDLKTVPIKMLKNTSTEMPLWFPKFIEEINKKMTYEGKGMWTFKGTDDFLPGFHIERVNDDYYITGKNDYGQEFQVTYESPRWEGDAAEKHFYKGEFRVDDAEPVHVDPDGNVDFDGILRDDIDEVLGGTTAMENVATKTTRKSLTKGEEQVIDAEMRYQSEVDIARDEGRIFDE